MTAYAARRNRRVAVLICPAADRGGAGFGFRHRSGAGRATGAADRRKRPQKRPAPVGRHRADNAGVMQMRRDFGRRSGAHGQTRASAGRAYSAAGGLVWTPWPPGSAAYASHAPCAAQAANGRRDAGDIKPGEAEHKRRRRALRRAVEPAEAGQAYPGPGGFFDKLALAYPRQRK